MYHLKILNNEKVSVYNPLQVRSASINIISFVLPTTLWHLIKGYTVTFEVPKDFNLNLYKLLDPTTVYKKYVRGTC